MTIIFLAAPEAFHAVNPSFEVVDDNDYLDGNAPWKDGFCTTCHEINRIEKNYCNYDCEYRRSDDMLEAIRKSLDPIDGYECIRYVGKKGWIDGFCSTCPSKLLIIMIIEIK